MLVNIGKNNYINTDRVVSYLDMDSLPAKRMVKEAKELGTYVDATKGRQTRGIIITDSHVVGVVFEGGTIAKRINEGKGEINE